MVIWWMQNKHFKLKTKIYSDSYVYALCYGLFVTFTDKLFQILVPAFNNCII